MKTGSYLEKGKCFLDGPGCELESVEPRFRGMGVLQYLGCCIICESNGGVSKLSRPSRVSRGGFIGGATLTKERIYTSFMNFLKDFDPFRNEVNI